MDALLSYLLRLFESGWLSLLDYLAAHVLLCLVPAFFIAGALSALIPQEVVTRYLGPRASKWISYPAAAVGGFILAVCSCTILPLFAGIWRRGAGLGPAITFLFVGPAVNILAIAYTGAAIGLDFAIARIVLSVAFGIAIGLIMAAIFRGEAQAPDADLFSGEAQVRPAVWVFFGLLVAILIAGTLQVNLLTRAYVTLHLDWNLPTAVVGWLEATHLNVQGALLILFLILIGLSAWRGMDRVHDSLRGWPMVTVALVLVTLLLAAPKVEETSSLLIEITGRAIAVTVFVAATVVVAARGLERDQVADWLWETWKFVKQIFPLLVAGVFVAGMAKVVIPETWVRALAGRNTTWANLIGVLFGVFMYFPTLVEVPVARMFLDLGMHRGPLLAYLMADPELSLQSILVTGRILGRRRTATYVALVTLFSTLAGYLFGLVLAAA